MKLFNSFVNVFFVLASLVAGVCTVVDLLVLDGEWFINDTFLVAVQAEGGNVNVAWWTLLIGGVGTAMLSGACMVRVLARFVDITYCSDEQDSGCVDTQATLGTTGTAWSKDYNALTHRDWMVLDQDGYVVAYGLTHAEATDHTAGYPWSTVDLMPTMPVEGKARRPVYLSKGVLPHQVRA